MQASTVVSHITTQRVQVKAAAAGDRVGRAPRVLKSHLFDTRLCILRRCRGCATTTSACSVESWRRNVVGRCALSTSLAAARRAVCARVRACSSRGRSRWLRCSAHGARLCASWQVRAGEAAMGGDEIESGMRVDDCQKVRARTRDQTALAGSLMVQCQLGIMTLAWKTVDRSAWPLHTRNAHTRCTHACKGYDCRRGRQWIVRLL